MKQKGYVEDKDKDRLFKINTTNVSKKIKTTKEIHTVAADFCHSENGKSLVALALID